MQSIQLVTLPVSLESSRIPREYDEHHKSYQRFPNIKHRRKVTMLKGINKIKVYQLQNSWIRLSRTKFSTSRNHCFKFRKITRKQQDDLKIKTRQSQIRETNHNASNLGIQEQFGYQFNRKFLWTTSCLSFPLISFFLTPHIPRENLHTSVHSFKSSSNLEVFIQFCSPFFILFLHMHDSTYNLIIIPWIIFTQNLCDC